MSDIRAMFTLSPYPITVAGRELYLRRPSALDIIEALQASKEMPDRMAAWFAWRHLVDEHRAPVFVSIDEALAADGLWIAKIGRMTEELYGEGRD